MSNFPRREFDNVIIRDAGYKDIEFISRYHKLFINGGLSNFSIDIIKVFYESCLTLEDKIFRVGIIGNKMRGFYLVHTGRSFSFSTVFWKRLFDFVKGILLSPKSLFVLVKSLFDLNKLPKCNYETEWLYQVVLPNTDKKDLAALLFEDIKRNLIQKGFSEIGGQMNSKNSFAVHYHKRLGVEFVDEFMRGKDKWIIIKHNIKNG